MGLMCSDDREAKSRVSGVGELSLVVGVAIWKGNQMPVLMYPVEECAKKDAILKTVR